MLNKKEICSLKIGDNVKWKTNNSVVIGKIIYIDNGKKYQDEGIIRFRGFYIDDEVNFCDEEANFDLSKNTIDNDGKIKLDNGENSSIEKTDININNTIANLELVLFKMERNQMYSKISEIKEAIKSISDKNSM